MQRHALQAGLPAVARDRIYGITLVSQLLQRKHALALRGGMRCCCLRACSHPAQRRTHPGMPACLLRACAAESTIHPNPYTLNPAACLPRRTPQGIRALVRCYCTLLLPVFFGPHYASLRSSIHIVYALFLAVVVRA